MFAYYLLLDIHEDFPPDPAAGPGAFWPVVGGGLMIAAWGLTLLARRFNRTDRGAAFHVSAGLAILMAAAGAAGLLAGPYFADMDPEKHVYQATVWLLLIWCAAHAALGILMNAYCIARRAAGRMTAEHDMDISNVALYWHFAS